MNRSILATVWLIALFGTAGAYPPPPKVEEKPDFDKLSKAAAEGFCRNMLKRDFDAVVKACDFPILFEEGKSLDKDQFRKELEGIPAEAFKEVRLTVKEAVAVEKFDAWGKALAKPPHVLQIEDRLKAMKERLGKGGWVVALKAEHQGMEDDQLGLVLVAFKDGKPRIVGFED